MYVCVFVCIEIYILIYVWIYIYTHTSFSFWSVSSCKTSTKYNVLCHKVVKNVTSICTFQSIILQFFIKHSRWCLHDLSKVNIQKPPNEFESPLLTKQNFPLLPTSNTYRLAPNWALMLYVVGVRFTKTWKGTACFLEKSQYTLGFACNFYINNGTSSCF